MASKSVCIRKGQGLFVDRLLLKFERFMSYINLFELELVKYLCPAQRSIHREEVLFGLASHTCKHLSDRLANIFVVYTSKAIQDTIQSIRKVRSE